MMTVGNLEHERNENSRLFTEVYNLRQDNELLTLEIQNLQRQISALELLADSDTLTPLPNRRFFQRELARVIEHVAAGHSQAALLFVDVDGLKKINDHHGHLAGDAALIHVAKLLRKTARPQDTVARLGGDEFAVIMAPVTDLEVSGQIDAVRRVIGNTHLMLDSERVDVKISAGFTMIAPDDSTEQAMQRADAAMYMVKRDQASAR